MSEPPAEQSARVEVDALRATYQALQERVHVAAGRAGRDPAEITLLVISKSVPAARLRAALAAGITTFGENRVQEAEGKATELTGATWHMVGHLQSNKAARAVGLFDVIQSVDSVELAQRLGGLAHDARDGRPLPVYLQVNVDLDPEKQGFDPKGLEAGMPALADIKGLEIKGLMTVGRLVGRPEDARSTFRRLRELSVQLREMEPRLGAGLSMGMSDDFEVAVDEGATVVRIGRALFGDRVAR